MYDLVIRNGSVVTASDVTRCDIGIRDGRIVTLGEALTAGESEVDATGHYVLPGGIDSHVHIAQPSGDGIVMAEDFESGTRSALAGGNTTVLPFCLQQKGFDAVDAPDGLDLPRWVPEPPLEGGVDERSQCDRIGSGQARAAATSPSWSGRSPASLAGNAQRSTAR